MCIKTMRVVMEQLSFEWTRRQTNRYTLRCTLTYTHQSKMAKVNTKCCYYSRLMPNDIESEKFNSLIRERKKYVQILNGGKS